MDTTPLAALLGTLVGLIQALSGAGGGILAVPLLVFGLHLPMQQAAPAGLMAAGLAAAVGAALGLREGIVRYRAAALIGVSGMLLAPLGVWLAQRIPNRPLLAAFGLVLAYTSWRMFRQAHQGPGAPLHGKPPCVINPEVGRLAWTLACARVLAASGMLSGVLSGLLGVGGGFVIVPVLTRYTDLGPRSVVATSLAVIALVSVGGVTAAAMNGRLEWQVALPFSAGAVVALLIGRLWARRLAGARLQQAFAAVSAVVSALVLGRALGVLGA